MLLRIGKICFAVIGMTILILAYRVTAYAESTYIKSSKELTEILAPKYLDYISLKTFKRPTHGGPRIIEIPYKSSVLSILNASLKALPGAARGINGKATLLSHPVYYKQLKKGENQKDQILLINYMVKNNVRGSVCWASQEDLFGAYCASWDLQIPALMNAYASILCDRMIREVEKQLKITRPTDAQRELLVSEVLKQDWVGRLSIDQQAYIKKHLILFELKKEEYTLCDHIGRWGQPKIRQNNLNLSRAYLTSLEGLDLIERSQEVTCLDLSQNYILGSKEDPGFVHKPFHLFSNVTNLKLYQNQLKDISGNFLQGLKKLKVLYLYDNKLRKVPNTLLKGVEDLEELYLGNNDLTTLPGGFFHFTPNLRSLSLRKNRMNKLPDCTLITKLQDLNLSDNQFVALQKDDFCGLSQLHHLNLNGNSITCLDEDALLPLKELVFLYLNNCRLTWIPEGFFKGLHQLQRLDLQGNHLVILPRNLFCDLKRVIHLNLANNGLLELSKGLFAHLENLHALDLHENSLIYVSLSSFASLRKLRWVDLRYNQLTETEDEFRKQCDVPKETWVHFGQTK